MQDFKDQTDAPIFLPAQKSVFVSDGSVMQLLGFWWRTLTVCFRRRQC